jgi:hypothetical protein
VTAFRVAALPAADLDRIRARGEDDFGNPLEPFAATGGGMPLRCCLRDAAPGEQVALIAYRPSPVPGPYAEVGPVFVHAQACDGYADEGRYPQAFRGRNQLLRAYDERGGQVENVVVDGSAAERAIGDLLGRPGVAFLHSRNVLAGCYMFAVHPAASVGAGAVSGS